MDLNAKEKLKLVDDLEYKISKLEGESKEFETKRYKFGDLTKGLVDQIKQAHEDKEAENRFLQGMRHRDHEHELAYEHTGAPEGCEDERP